MFFIMGRVENLLSLVKEKLEDGEEIINYVDGALERNINGKGSLKTGILVATNKKVRFLGKRFFKVYDDFIEYKDIYNVEINEEKLGYRIFFHNKKNSCTMKYVEGKDIKGFVNYIKDKKGKIKNK